jgi:hypothetical protein
MRKGFEGLYGLVRDRLQLEPLSGHGLPVAQHRLSRPLSTPGFSRSPSSVTGSVTVTRFGNPCDVPFRSSGITRNPHNENKEKN